MSSIPEICDLWTSRVPSNRDMEEIEQIRYVFPPHAQEKVSGMMVLYTFNSYITDDKPSYKCQLPAVYFHHFRRLIFRLDHFLHYHDLIKYKKCTEDFPKLKTALSELKLYIDYMDKVIDAVLDVCIEAEEEGTLNPEWRCKPLDAWLSIEYVVKRHSDDAVSKWRLDGGNIALLHLDPLEYDWVTFDEENAILNFTKSVNDTKRVDLLNNVRPILLWICEGIGLGNPTDEQNIKGKKTNVGAKQSSSTNKASPSAVAKSQEKNQGKTQTKRKGAAKGKAKAKAKAMLSDSDGNSSAEEIVQVERLTARQKSGSEKKGPAKPKKVSPRQRKGKPFKSSSVVESDDDDKKGSDNASIVETAAASKKSSEKPVLKRPRTSTDASSRPRQRQAMSSDISRQVSQALSVTGLRDKLDTGSARSKRPSPASSTWLTRHSSRSGADASRRSTPIDRPVAGPSGTSDDVDIQWDASIPPAAAPPPQNIVKESD